MKYDFNSVPDRSKLGSSKWNDMLKANPNVPPGIIPLSVADMELQNAPQIMSALRGFLDEKVVSLGYTSYTESYTKAVKGWMQRRHSWDVDMEWNILSPGVVTTLFCAVRAFTDPGDGVIIFSPVYYPFKMAVEANKRKTADVPLVRNGLRYEIDWAAFERAAKKEENKLLLFCSPHNPVARVWTQEELLRVSDICLKHNVIVLSDEIHNDLIMPGHSHTVFAKLNSESEQNSIICTSPSKSFSLAGLQTSNIFVPNKALRRRLREVMFESGIFSLNAVGFRACEAAYNECEDWLEEAIALINNNAGFVEDFIASNIPEIQVFPLEGTYLQWWDCSRLFDDHKQLEDFMHTKALLFLDEGYMFGDTGRGYERINLACPQWVLADAMTRLKDALVKYQ